MIQGELELVLMTKASIHTAYTYLITIVTSEFNSTSIYSKVVLNMGSIP